MADTEAKAEIPKDVLAPADGIREDLVGTAVKFLQNPKVTQSPLSQKRAFLQRKGLTDEEVEVAIQRCGITQHAEPQDVQNANVHQGTVVAGLGQSPGLPQKYHDSVEVTRWHKARDVLAVVTMITGISYAAYKLYKEFLCPWLFGYVTPDKRLSDLEKIVGESMSNVNTSLAFIEQTLGKQQEKLQTLSHDVNRKTGGNSASDLHSHQSISEIKSELTSIKGLLLNRRQFPPVPTTTPVLPSWQLANSAGDADNSNKKGTEISTETTPKVTFSASPAAESLTQVSIETNLEDKETEEVAVVAKNSENEADKLENEAVIENEAEASGVKVTGQDDDTDSNGSVD